MIRTSLGLLLCARTMISKNNSASPPTERKSPKVELYMDYEYKVPWKYVQHIVDKEKRLGPGDDMVTLDVNDNKYVYTVHMPWYAWLFFSRKFLWEDTVEVDYENQTRTEIGTNLR